MVIRWEIYINDFSSGLDLMSTPIEDGIPNQLAASTLDQRFPRTLILLPDVTTI